jgi:hypothetical protein
VKPAGVTADIATPIAQKDPHASATQTQAVAHRHHSSSRRPARHRPATVSALSLPVQVRMFVGVGLVWSEPFAPVTAFLLVLSVAIADQCRCKPPDSSALRVG